MLPTREAPGHTTCMCTCTHAYAAPYPQGLHAGRPACATCMKHETCTPRALAPDSLSATATDVCLCCTLCRLWVLADAVAQANDCNSAGAVALGHALWNHLLHERFVTMNELRAASPSLVPQQLQQLVQQVLAGQRLGGGGGIGSSAMSVGEAAAASTQGGAAGSSHAPAAARAPGRAASSAAAAAAASDSAEGSAAGRSKNGKAQARQARVPGQCAACGASNEPGSGVRLMTCNGCEEARYCSKACQKGHWKQHKQACRAAQAALQA